MTKIMHIFVITKVFGLGTLKFVYLNIHYIMKSTKHF